MLSTRVFRVITINCALLKITLRSRVGSSLDIGERYTAPTLWGSTAFIADDLSKVAEEFANLKNEILTPMKRSITSLTTSEVERSATSDKVVRAVKWLLARVQTVNQVVQEVKTDLLIIRTEQGVRFSTPKSPVEASDELMDFVISEEAAEAATSVDGGGRTIRQDST